MELSDRQVIQKIECVLTIPTPTPQEKGQGLYIALAVLELDI